MKGREKRYALTRNRIYELDEGWEILSHWDTQASPKWEYLDFGPYNLLSNGSQMFVSSLTTGDLEPVISEDLPPMKVMCNYNGMIVGGGVEGLDPDWVVWSQVGHASFTMDRSGMAGRRPLMEMGEVLKILQLGDSLVVYGSWAVGILRLNPELGAIAYRVIADVGIKNCWCASGDKRGHVFLGADGILRNISVEFQITELGYEEFLHPLVDPVISYDPFENDWYISDVNTSYVYGSKVLFSCFQSVSSCVREDGILHGTVVDLQTHHSELLTDSINMGIGGRKSLEVVEVLSSVSGWFVQGISSPNETPWIPVNPTSQARVKITGDHLRVRVRRSSYIEATIDHLNVRWKLPDKRFIRGIYAGAAGDESDH